MANPLEFEAYIEGLKSEAPAQEDHLNLLLQTYRGLINLGMNPLELPTVSPEQPVAESSEREKPDWTLTIGGKPRREIKKMLREGRINVGTYAQDMVDKLSILREPQEIGLVRRSLRDLDLTRPSTLAQILERGQERGYDPCPAEVGPYQRLKDTGQKVGDFYYIAMNPIPDRHGGPGVFWLGRYGGGLWLGGRWACPGDGWDPDGQLVFALRKSA